MSTLNIYHVKKISIEPKISHLRASDVNSRTLTVETEEGHTIEINMYARELENLWVWELD